MGINLAKNAHKMQPLIDIDLPDKCNEGCYKLVDTVGLAVLCQMLQVHKKFCKCICLYMNTSTFQKCISLFVNLTMSAQNRKKNILDFMYLH